MSGQWEVVGKNKKDKQSGKSKKLSKIEKQKFVDNAPKVEDLLPLAQVQTLYSALDTNKEVIKPIEKATKTKENEAKKAQKKQKEKKEPTAKETSKPPKTIEAAIALISVAEVQSVLEVGQMRFSEAPLVWLKGLASWLNVKLPVDHTDNVFTAKSWEYPLCLLSADIRAVLKKALKEVPDSAVQMFYDYCLTSMANDMTKGSPVTGYKMLLQLVASQQPQVAASNLTKASGLRHSYQNRPAIGCSVMWALGQAGFKDLPTGLQVWLNVMVPVLELRHYTQFVCDYLKHVLARHSTSKAVSAELYFNIMDTISTTSHNSLLSTHMNTLKAILKNTQPSDRLHNLVEPLLCRLKDNFSPALRQQMVEFLVECLAKDTQSFAEWRQVYTRYLPESAILLAYFSTVNFDLGKNTRHLKDTVKTFKVTNDDMIKNKQRAEGLKECNQLCNNILNEIAESKSFPWKSLSVFIILATSLVLAYDIKIHGSFRGSKTGIFLKDVGALKYGEQATVRVKEVWLQAYGWSKQNVPQYLSAVWPYVVTASDFVMTHTARVTSNLQLFYLEKKPLVEQWVSKNLPGLQERLAAGVSEAGRVALHVASLLKEYFFLVVEWVQQNVSMGDIQRLTLEAFNSTQTAAAKALSWLAS